MMYRTATLVLLTATLALPARAQYAAQQIQTLEGLQRVYVALLNEEGYLDPQQAQDLHEWAQLELRKAGLRVVNGPEELTPREDAVLNIIFLMSDPAPVREVWLRMDVEQNVILRRTRQQYQLVTWYYEDGRRTAEPAEDARHMLETGVNQFLSDWLDANGR